MKFDTLPQTCLVDEIVAIRVVDLSSHAPTSGSYEGVDAMGLFWSRAPVDGDLAKGFEGMSKDPLTATVVAEMESNESPISHPIRRVYVGPGVVSREVRERKLFGKMFEPAQRGPDRAVFVVGGSDGGRAWSREMAALLASHGYVALASAYFAAEDCRQRSIASRLSTSARHWIGCRLKLASPGTTSVS